MTSFKAMIALGLTALTLSGCAMVGRGAAAEEDIAMRWDHVPASDAWEERAYAALDTHAAILPTLVPDDVTDWCPGYPDNDLEDRRHFWVALVSTLARHESTYNSRAIGGGGRWYGLVQILPSTARGYGCRARSGDALLDGGANVSCAFRIWSTTVPRDNVVSRGNRGVAADWGPLHSSQSRKREDMRAWIREQSYCQA